MKQIITYKPPLTVLCTNGLRSRITPRPFHLRTAHVTLRTSAASSLPTSSDRPQVTKNHMSQGPLTTRPCEPSLSRIRSGLSTFNKGQNGSDRKRFWKGVHIRRVDDDLRVFLDSRPLRRPNSKILTIPMKKPLLATAIALEWELLETSQQALKPHYTPLTGLASRALDIADSDDSLNNDDKNNGFIRTEIVTSLLRYFDTDSLLCWAPLPPSDPPGYETHVSRVEPLRNLQERATKSILEFLQDKVWPGIKIEPTLEGNTIIPKSHSPETRKIIHDWMLGLDAWDLAALERGVIAAKSLLGAVRLIVEWGESFKHLIDEKERRTREAFGIETAAVVASLELEWQIGMWGLVEDTHDVEREDLRRQLGSIVLLVSGG